MSDDATIVVPDPPASPAEDARMVALQAKLDTLRASDAKRVTDETAAKKTADDAAALARGEHEGVIKRQADDMAALQTKVDAMEAAAKARTDANIEKLSETDQAEIEIVRGSLGSDLLEQLVAQKLGAAPPAAEGTVIAPGTTLPSKRQSKDHQVSEATNAVFDAGYVSHDVREMAKSLGKTPERNGTYGFKRSGNHRRNTAVMIDMLNDMAADPLFEKKQKRRERIMK